jgi:ubiquitin C-terminal hydrolase
MLWYVSCVQITCEGVDYTSSTFDPFLDLSLEITKAHSLTRALQHFTAAEVLDGDNKYRCPKNNKLVRAQQSRAASLRCIQQIDYITRASAATLSLADLQVVQKWTPACQ